MPKAEDSIKENYTNVVKLPVTAALRRHSYLNGLGGTERLSALDREWRRLRNTIAVLTRRASACNRLIRIELKKEARAAAEGVR